jgi:hypothetical protein
VFFETSKDYAISKQDARYFLSKPLAEKINPLDYIASTFYPQETDTQNGKNAANWRILDKLSTTAS